MVTYTYSNVSRPCGKREALSLHPHGLGKRLPHVHLPTDPFSTMGYCGYSKRTSSSCPQNEGANENGWNIRPNDCSNVDSAWSGEEQQRAMIHCQRTDVIIDDPLSTYRCQRTDVIVQMYRGKTNAESLLRWNLIYKYIYHAAQIAQTRRGRFSNRLGLGYI